MARQMKAEREKRAQILEAEGMRQSEILKAEGQKQALILAGRGPREAAFRDAEARERLAEAEARATAMVCEAIAEGDVSGVNFFVAQRYTEALEGHRDARPNQQVLMLPIEASALIGSLAGIAELAKASSARRRPRGRARPDVPRSPADGPDAHDPRFIAELGAWAWWFSALLLLALELLAPGIFFVWFGHRRDPHRRRSRPVSISRGRLAAHPLRGRSRSSRSSSAGAVSAAPLRQRGALLNERATPRRRRLHPRRPIVAARAASGSTTASGG